MDSALGPDLHPGELTAMASKRSKLDPLEEAVGHRFIDRSHLELALTHVSAAALNGSRAATYQRLEFLGDRVLGLGISELLFSAYPTAAEGELSRRLAELVRKESCAEVAEAWDVGPHLRLGGGEASSGARRNRAILADVCEAIVGAVFIDGGYEAARGVIERAFGERMRTPKLPLRDAKTALQEWAQGRGLPTPAYVIVERRGPDHAPEFRVAVAVHGMAGEDATGLSRRMAEQAAAARFLLREGVWKGELLG